MSCILLTSLFVCCLMFIGGGVAMLVLSAKTVCVTMCKEAYNETFVNDKLACVNYGNGTLQFYYWCAPQTDVGLLVGGCVLLAMGLVPLMPTRR